MRNSVCDQSTKRSGQTSGTDEESNPFRQFRLCVPVREVEGNCLTETSFSDTLRMETVRLCWEMRLSTGLTTNNRQTYTPAGFFTALWQLAATDQINAAAEMLKDGETALARRVPGMERVI